MLIIDAVGGDKDKFKDRLKAAEHYVRFHPYTTETTVVIPPRLPEGISISKSLYRFTLADTGMTIPNLLREDPSRVLVTAGDTRQLIETATQNKDYLKQIGRIGRVSPMLFTTIPQGPGQAILGDVGGGSLFPDESNMPWAALAGRLIARSWLSLPGKVALINVGDQTTKGGSHMEGIFDLLAELLGDDFVGNCEPSLILESTANVFVTGGFVGNVVIKTTSYVGKQTRYSVNHSRLGPLALPIAGLFKTLFMGEMSLARHNGAWLVGLKCRVVKAHGHSNAQEYLGAILRAGDPRTVTIFDAVTTDPDIKSWITARGGVYAPKPAPVAES